MAGTVIDTALVPEAISEVRNDLSRSGPVRILIVLKRDEAMHEGFGVQDHPGVPGTVGEVSVPGGLADGGGVVDELD